MQGMHFSYYTKAALRLLIGERYQILALEIYGEMEDGDSLYVVLAKPA